MTAAGRRSAASSAATRDAEAPVNVIAAARSPGTGLGRMAAVAAGTNAPVRCVARMRIPLPLAPMRIVNEGGSRSPQPAPHPRESASRKYSAACRASRRRQQARSHDTDQTSSA
jgi:hypothetical protein